MAKSQFLGFLIIVILIALFSSWLLRSIEHKSEIKTQDTVLNRDYYLTEFSTIIMDEMGNPYYKLSAPHLDHYPKNQITKIKKPELLVYSSKDYPWSLVSEHAQVSNKGNLIYFTGDVILNRSAALITEKIVIITNELSIFVKEQIATSESNIKFIQHNNYIEANSMVLDLKNHIVELAANVKSQYKIQRH